MMDGSNAAAVPPEVASAAASSLTMDGTLAKCSPCTAQLSAARTSPPSQAQCDSTSHARSMLGSRFTCGGGSGPPAHVRGDAGAAWSAGFAGQDANHIQRLAIKHSASEGIGAGAEQHTGSDTSQKSNDNRCKSYSDSTCAASGAGSTFTPTHGHANGAAAQNQKAFDRIWAPKRTGTKTSGRQNVPAPNRTGAKTSGHQNVRAPKRLGTKTYGHQNVPAPKRTGIKPALPSNIH
eukprot:355105-Chlamydomonas_euryale.AAC.11